MIAEFEAIATLYTSEVAGAVHALAHLISRQHAGDENYFHNQVNRYARTVSRIRELRPNPRRVLDIGSHYLHQSVLLSELGYQVSGIDIELFTSAAFVQERAHEFNVQNLAVNLLEKGDFLPGMEGQFDVIVFTEILEHITFNPVRFWKRVYELLTPDGIIYLSTPNSMRPAAVLRSAANLIRMRGVGLDIGQILGTVTYGHHWKEYSAWEIRKYFAMLSDDFAVETHWYSTDLHTHAGPKGQLKRLIAVVPCFRSDIEALITRPGTGGFSAVAPRLAMQTRPPPESL